MPNACFRCKLSLPSGETFCDACRTEVTLAADYTTSSRLWLVVAGALVGQALAFLSGLGYVVVMGSGSLSLALLTGLLLAWFPGLVLAVALWADAGHGRRRDDTDWNPGKWTYILVSWAGVIVVVPGTLLGLYHLYRRRQTVGFPRSRH